MLRFKHYLMLEAKIDDYKAQETNISTEHDPHAEHKSADKIIDHFHKASPGGNVQHTRWMIDRYKKGEMRQEDAPDMKNTLKGFEKYKSQLPKKKIEQYKSIDELKTALHPHQEKDEGVKAVNQDKINKGSTVVHDSPNVTAYHVHTTEAAQELGKTPKGEKLGWCTSHEDPEKNMFNHYNKESNGNFHILHMHKEQYPYRRIGGIGVKDQFQDENNKVIKESDLHGLLHRNPELEKIPAVKESSVYKEHKKFEKAYDPNISKEDLDKIVNHEDYKFRLTATKNPNLTKEHINKLLDDKGAVDHYNNDTSYLVRSSAVKHPNATAEHIDKALNDADSYVRIAALENKNANEKHIDKGLKDENSIVKRAAINNPNATLKHIHKGLADNSEFIRDAAQERLKSFNQKD